MAHAATCPLWGPEGGIERLGGTNAPEVAQLDDGRLAGVAACRHQQHVLQLDVPAPPSERLRSYLLYKQGSVEDADSMQETAE